jgi:hypothetical protein
MFENVKVSLFRGDLSKPILVVDAPSLSGPCKGFELHIIPSISSSAFSLEDLMPASTAIQPPIFADRQLNERAQEYDQMEADNKVEVRSLGFYKQSILEDMFFTTHLKFLHAVFDDSKAMRDAVLLFKAIHSTPCSLLPSSFSSPRMEKI